jgi:hypothetical protein
MSDDRLLLHSPYVRAGDSYVYIEQQGELELGIEVAMTSQSHAIFGAPVPRTADEDGRIADHRRILPTLRHRGLLTRKTI